jgi:hypothetical protein
VAAVRLTQGEVSDELVVSVCSADGAMQYVVTFCFVAHAKTPQRMKCRL